MQTPSLGWALAQEGLRVIVLDLDYAGGQAAMHLCERNAGPTLREALQAINRLDPTLLDTLLTTCSAGLRLLPSPREHLSGEGEFPCSGLDLSNLVQTAASLADVVLLDLPGTALTHPSFAPLLGTLDQRVMVGEPSLPCTYNARRGLQHLEALMGALPVSAEIACEFVLNKVGRHDPISPREVRRALSLESQPKAWRELPRSDALVAQATYEGMALGAFSPRDPLAQAVTEWAREWAQEWAPARSPGGPGGLATAGREDPSWRQLWRRWAS